MTNQSDVDRYLKVAAMADEPSASQGERDNATAILERMEKRWPGIGAESRAWAERSRAAGAMRDAGHHVDPSVLGGAQVERFMADLAQRMEEARQKGGLYTLFAEVMSWAMNDVTRLAEDQTAATAHEEHRRRRRPAASEGSMTLKERFADEIDVTFAAMDTAQIKVGKKKKNVEIIVLDIAIPVDLLDEILEETRGPKTLLIWLRKEAERGVGEDREDEEEDPDTDEDPDEDPEEEDD